MDVSAAQGDLCCVDRYDLGKTSADYYVSKSAFKGATVGKPPLVDGFAAVVASNRGVTAETFSDTTRAADWLNRFGRTPKIQR